MLSLRIRKILVVSVPAGDEVLYDDNNLLSSYNTSSPAGTETIRQQLKTQLSHSVCCRVKKLSNMTKVTDMQR